MAIVYSIITEGLHLVNQESPCFGTQKGESETSIPAFPGDTALFGPYTTIRSGHGSQCHCRLHVNHTQALMLRAPSLISNL